jgi:hypothetical protein
MEIKIQELNEVNLSIYAVKDLKKEDLSYNFT